MKISENSVLASWTIDDELRIVPEFENKHDGKLFFDNIEDACKLVTKLTKMITKKKDKKTIFNEYVLGEKSETKRVKEPRI